MARPTLVVANVLLNKAAEVLLGLRADGLGWEVPGGKVENETILEAAHRELREETGLVTSGVPRFLGTSEPNPQLLGGKRLVILFYVIRQWQGFPRRMEPKKCLMWKWIAFKNFPALEHLSPGTRDLAEFYLPSLARVEVPR